VTGGSEEQSRHIQWVLCIQCLIVMNLFLCHHLAPLDVAIVVTHSDMLECSVPFSTLVFLVILLKTTLVS